MALTHTTPHVHEALHDEFCGESAVTCGACVGVAVCACGVVLVDDEDGPL